MLVIVVHVELILWFSDYRIDSVDDIKDSL